MLTSSKGLQWFYFHKRPLGHLIPRGIVEKNKRRTQLITLKLKINGIVKDSKMEILLFYLSFEFIYLWIWLEDKFSFGCLFRHISIKNNLRVIDQIIVQLYMDLGYTRINPHMLTEQIYPACLVFSGKVPALHFPWDDRLVDLYSPYKNQQ